MEEVTLPIQTAALKFRVQIRKIWHAELWIPVKLLMKCYELEKRDLSPIRLLWSRCATCGKTLEEILMVCSWNSCLRQNLELNAYNVSFAKICKVETFASCDWNWDRPKATQTQATSSLAFDETTRAGISNRCGSNLFDHKISNYFNWLMIHRCMISFQ